MRQHVMRLMRPGTLTRRAGRLIAVLALLMSAAVTVVPSAPVAAAAATTAVTVDGNSPGRVFDGVGALSAGASSRLLIDYPEPARSQILDYLFKPGYGAALQILKVEIGGDTNSTDGTEPSHMHTATDLSCDRGYEWWLMEQAKARNPSIKLYALEWGAPGWVGAGTGTVWTTQNISYILSWLGCAKQHGLSIDYLGGWNERGFDAAWYEQLRSALNANGYSSVQIVADDSYNWNVVSAMDSDPAFASSVGIVGQHYVCGIYGPYENCPSTQAAEDLGKPIWASEQGSQPYDTGAAPLARAINREYIDGQMTATINWSLIWSAYAGLPYEGDGLMLANTPWSGNYTVGPSVWAVAQTTQFTQPGWRYLNSGSMRIPGGSVVSLRAPDSGNWSAIAETLDATTAQQVSFTVSGGLSTGPVHVWATNPNSSDPSQWFNHVGDIQPQNGQFTATLQPGYVYSFTTTSGQGKGSATAPPAAAWQLPYHDNFESYPADSTPRYFSDLGGTFATAPCQGGRDGMCLRSVVSQQPVLWYPGSADNYPLTVVGDPANWHNYQVGVDALLEQSGSVTLGGRVINGVSGYHLTVASSGQWTLTKVNSSGTATTLASGTTSVGVGTWHRLTLTLRELEVTAAIDGTTLATVSDQTYDTGQVSLSTSAWQNAEFDNLVVTPALGNAAKLTVHITPTPVSLPQPGDSGNVSAQVTNPGTIPATGVSLTAAAPQGWTITPVSSGGTSLAAGQTASWSWKVTAPASAAPGIYHPTLTLQYASGGQNGEVTQDMTVDVEVLNDALMTASATSNQQGYPPSNALDGDPATLWHSEYSPDRVYSPQELTLNLGKDYDISGFLYLPRQDGVKNGIITNYQIWVSQDGVTYTQVAQGTWAQNEAMKQATFTTQEARYVRLVGVYGANGYVSAADVYVIGNPQPAPVTLTSAQDRVGIGSAGGSAALAANVSNPGQGPATDVTAQLQVPSGWSASATSSVPATLAAGQSASPAWTITAPASASPGPYPVTVEVQYTEGGVSWTGQWSVTVDLGILNNAQITASASSQQPGYAAGNVLDDDPNTLWSVEYSPVAATPPQSITLDLGSSAQVSGLLYLPRQDGTANGTITGYQVWVSQDGTNYTEVTSGSWAGSASMKEADFPVQAARYVRLVATSGAASTVTAADLYVLGS